MGSKMTMDITMEDAKALSHATDVSWPHSNDCTPKRGTTATRHHGKHAVFVQSSKMPKQNYACVHVCVGG